MKRAVAIGLVLIGFAGLWVTSALFAQQHEGKKESPRTQGPAKVSFETGLTETDIEKAKFGCLILHCIQDSALKRLKRDDVRDCVKGHLDDKEKQKFGDREIDGLVTLALQNLEKAGLIEFTKDGEWQNTAAGTTYKKKYCPQPPKPK